MPKLKPSEVAAHMGINVHALRKRIRLGYVKVTRKKNGWYEIDTKDIPEYSQVKKAKNQMKK